MTREQFVWRSMLFVPATSDRFVESALKQPADALQIDLEDSVAPDFKESARQRLPQIADNFAAAGLDVLVRVNRPWRLLVRDLEASVRASVHAVSLPKVPDASHIRAAAEVLDECEREHRLPIGHTRIIAMVEDAEGLHNMAAIAAAHPRVYGMIVGSEDLAASLRMVPDEDGLYVHNVMGVAACRRAGIEPIGFVGSIAEFADQDAFRARIRRARRLGFTGCFCIHPKQVIIANEEFSPQPEEVEHARGLVAEFERQVAAGQAAHTYKGRMVDLPIVEQARQVIARQEAIERRARRAAR
ncbi:MAG TPA: CoA ester lyase [Burkholderiales bacterium]|nr:CoA ester lyase [Burkholderiales bacterium]